MKKRSRTLRIYLDCCARENGKHEVGLVIADGKGAPLHMAREQIKATSARQALYTAYFTMLEEAVVHEGDGLLIQLSPTFGSLDLSFDPDARAAEGRKGEREICKRIRELSSAFEQVSATLLRPGEVNPAAALLDRDR